MLVGGCVDDGVLVGGGLEPAGAEDVGGKSPGVDEGGVVLLVLEP